MKRLIVFDLDGTLAESKTALDTETSLLLGGLLSIVKVAIISGGDWPQFEDQVLAKLPKDGRLKNLSLLPTCGTKFYKFENEWERLYAETFTDTERDTIVDALKHAVQKADFKIDHTWGETIEDRGSQVTLSALGQQAPREEKAKWDPDYTKRRQLKSLLDPELPNFTVRMGGTTSIDITRHGVDKGYGIRKLRDELDIAIHEMIFVGDAIFPGGNDYPAKKAGVVSIEVQDPNQTKRVIEAVLACLADTAPTPRWASR
jgi:HAD superfamily hydrolase (TIGR01484 family)